MGIRNAGFSNEGQGRALIELAMQYSPKNAIREYVTNGLDARLNGRPENITVALYPNQKKLIISDDGTGIPYDKLMSLPVKIGESGKYGRIDSRGEKALGLLAFGSLGKTMHMLSRHC